MDCAIGHIHYLFWLRKTILGQTLAYRELRYTARYFALEVYCDSKCCLLYM